MARTPLLAGLLVGLVLLSGCADDPEPKFEDWEPSATASSEPAPEPSMPASSTPTPAQNLSPRSLVDAWLTAWTHALRSGDVDDVRVLSSPDCVSCSRLTTKVEALYAKGGRLDTEGWAPTRVARAPGSRDETPTFVMQVRQARQTLYGADGNIVEVTPAATVPMRMTLVAAGEGWILGTLEILE
ncbi:DUF6318 family protein [uncultured Nocardioides sp.]|uniref:DUF6318 family protein n=1 Tax=uncultured Nocardioides sp. TaxID=198441 RepID=UPI00344B1EA6